MQLVALLTQYAACGDSAQCQQDKEDEDSNETFCVKPATLQDIGLGAACRRFASEPRVQPIRSPPAVSYTGSCVTMFTILHRRWMLIRWKVSGLDAGHKVVGAVCMTQNIEFCVQRVRVSKFTGRDQAMAAMSR